MSQQTHKQTIQASRIRLEPKRLDDDAINAVYQTESLHKVLRGSEGLSVIVGFNSCLLHDLASPSHWHHYQLPESVKDSAMSQNSARLWVVTNSSNLATLDLHNNEWMAFHRTMHYAAILYAEEDIVFVRRETMFAIDVFKLQDEHIRRVASLPIPIAPVKQVNSEQPLAHEYKIEDAVFLPEENQFIILWSANHQSQSIFTLQRLRWDGHEETILSVEAKKAMLRPPFLVLYRAKPQEFAFADLRKSPVTVKHISLDLEPKGDPSKWFLEDVFAFGDELVASLISSPLNNRIIAAFVRLTGDHPEVLHRDRFAHCNLPAGKQLGRFLISDEAIIDLVTRQKTIYIPRATLLRRAIQDEAKQQQRASNAKPSLPLAQETEHSDPNVFSVYFQTLPETVTEAFNQNIRFLDAISSEQGDFAFVASSVVDNAKACLLLKDKNQVQYLLPQSEIFYEWSKITFDEQGRVWVCNRRADHIAVLHARKQEGVGFTVNHVIHSGPKAIAAFANYLAIACHDNTFLVYYYDGNSLMETFRRKINSQISGIKPDPKNGRWWILTLSNHEEMVYELKYISSDADSNALKTIEQIPYPVAILGNWPEQVYFVYVDDEHQLHYTSDPLSGWHTIPLQHIVVKEKTQDDNYVLPLSLHSIDGSIFMLLKTPDAYLFTHAQANTVALISAFQLKSSDDLVTVAHWGNWLILRSNQSLAPARDQKEIALLPENKGTLFFHTLSWQFYPSLYVPYAAMGTLRRVLKDGSNIILKSLL